MKTISKNLILFLFGFTLINCLIGCQDQTKKCEVCGTYYFSFHENMNNNRFFEELEMYILNMNCSDEKIDKLIEAVGAKYNKKPISKDIEKEFQKVLKEMKKQRICINSNGSWEYFSLNNNSEAKEKGTWEITESPFEGKVINICVGKENWKNNKKCVIKFGTVGTDSQYLKWDNKMFFRE